MAIEPRPIEGDPLDPNIVQGLGADLAQPLEGLSDDPTITEMDDGTKVVDFSDSANSGATTPQPETHDENLAPILADRFGEEYLDKIGKRVVEWFERDDRSRTDWKKTYTDGLELLGLNIEERSDPWEGACGVFHPVLTEAVVRFQSQAIMEIFPASGPVKTKLIGKWSKEKEEQAARVQQELNFYVTERMTEFRAETEVLLFYLPLAGAAFRKNYYCPVLGRPTSVFVPAEDFIVPYGTSDLRSCPRYTHVIRTYLNNIRKETASGFYRPVELRDPELFPDSVQKQKDKLEGRSPEYQTNSQDERYILLESHCTWDLQGYEDTRIDPETGENITTGIELPYVVTVERNSGKVLAIRRNWEEKDPQKERIQHFTAYSYLPGLGFYGSGLIHLIGGIAKSATSILRQLVDAGTLSNLPGGLKTRGLRIKGDDTPIMPGEFRDVDVPSGSIRDNITFIPYKEPSTVLHALLNDIIAEGRRLGAAPDLPINAMTQQAPVGTTLALLERSMKVMSAVQARLHASLKLDFKRIAEIIAEDMGPKYEYEVDDPEASRVEDFSQVDIIPVSDPNAASLAQRVVQMQAGLQLAASDPTAFDRPQMYKDALTVLGYPNVNKAVKDPENIPPMDPVAENMAIITGKPVKAYLWQDHEAHIKVHLAAIHDPKIAQMVGQSPQASLISGAASAHVAEHLGFAYRQEIEKQMGVPLPPPDQPLPEEVEVRLSRAVAVAAERLLGKNIQEQQMQRNQQLLQDPVVQLQQREVAVKEQEVQRKAAADKADAVVEVVKVLQKSMEGREKIASQERIAGAALGVEIATTKDKLEETKRDQIIDVAKELADLQARAEELRVTERVAKEQARAKAKQARQARRSNGATH